MRIESLRSEPDRAGHYWLTLEDGSRMGLYRQTVEDFAIFPGRDLTEQELSELRQAAGAMSAKMRAVRIVAASAVSGAELRQRLEHKGEDPRQAEQAVQWLQQMNLLDDGETARQLVSRCVSRGYGIHRARQVLYEKKIPKELWDEALQDYPDPGDYIDSFLRQRVKDPRDSASVKRAVDALVRRGYSYGDVRSALNRLRVDGDFLEE